MKRAEGTLNGGEQRLNLHGVSIEEKTAILNAYETKDWNVVYKSWIDELTRWWEDKDHHNELNTEQGGLSDLTFMASVEQYKWMEEYKLTPVHHKLQRPYLWTIYDKFLSPMEQLEWNQETRKFDHTGLFYLYLFLTTPSYLLLIIMLLFVLGIGLSAEKGIRRSLTLLKTQP